MTMAKSRGFSTVTGNFCKPVPVTHRSFQSNGSLGHLLIYRTSFVVEYLLHPKTRYELLSRPSKARYSASVACRQLDDLSRTVKYLPAAGRARSGYVCGHEGKGNGELSKCSLSDKLHILKPFKAMFLQGFCRTCFYSEGWCEVRKLFSVCELSRKGLQFAKESS
jgi:hypothetical protein